MSGVLQLHSSRRLTENFTVIDAAAAATFGGFIFTFIASLVRRHTEAAIILCGHVCFECTFQWMKSSKHLPLQFVEKPSSFPCRRESRISEPPELWIPACDGMTD